MPSSHTTQQTARDAEWEASQAKHDAIDAFERRRDLAERIALAMAQGDAMAMSVSAPLTAGAVVERAWALADLLDSENERRRPKPAGEAR